MVSFDIFTYLAIKEIWRNRGRFLLFSLVISLITLLVLFTAALGEGLGSNNREYISKIDAQLIVFLAKSDFSIPASRLDASIIRALRREKGIAGVGGISTSSTAIMLPGNKVLKVSLLGVESDQPGMPTLTQGSMIRSNDANEVIIDRKVSANSGIQLGDTITIRSTQGTKDEFYTLKVVGTTSGQSYFFAPTIFVPPSTWERVRPKSAAELDNTKPLVNIAAIRLENPADAPAMRLQLVETIDNIEVADIPTTINNIPGYTAQQGTLTTQGGFTMLIGVLIIGGFFQIQILQKVPQIGVLKAIGASNPMVGLAAILQIMIVTGLGVFIGSGLAYLFSLSLPPNIPFVFNGINSALAILALLSIGPIGGMVSVIYAIRIEPLKALRLS